MHRVSEREVIRAAATEISRVVIGHASFEQYCRDSRNFDRLAEVHGNRYIITCLVAAICCGGGHGEDRRRVVVQCGDEHISRVSTVVIAIQRSQGTEHNRPTHVIVVHLIIHSTHCQRLGNVPVDRGEGQERGRHTTLAGVTDREGDLHVLLRCGGECNGEGGLTSGFAHRAIESPHLHRRGSVGADGDLDGQVGLAGRECDGRGEAVGIEVPTLGFELRDRVGGAEAEDRQPHRGVEGQVERNRAVEQIGESTAIGLKGEVVLCGQSVGGYSENQLRPHPLSEVLVAASAAGEGASGFVLMGERKPNLRRLHSLLLHLAARKQGEGGREQTNQQA